VEEVVVSSRNRFCHASGIVLVDLGSLLSDAGYVLHRLGKLFGRIKNSSTEVRLSHELA